MAWRIYTFTSSASNNTKSRFWHFKRSDKKHDRRLNRRRKAKGRPRLSNRLVKVLLQGWSSLKYPLIITLMLLELRSVSPACNKGTIISTTIRWALALSGVNR